jgi:hypothetical protein
LQDAAQMRLAQDDTVVHTLASDRSDQSFGKAILPRRDRRDRLIPDAHGAHSGHDDGAIDLIPIADEVMWRLIPGECLSFALQQMKLYAPMTGIISRPLVSEGTYITKETRDQSRLATIVQLDPIRAIGQAPAAMYFKRGEILTSIEQAAARREFSLVLPTGDKYPHKAFNPETQTVEVTVEFPKPDLLLRPGLNVTLQSSIRAK